jgi:hypothetical protein
METETTANDPEPTAEQKAEQAEIDKLFYGGSFYLSRPGAYRRPMRVRGLQGRPREISGRPDAGAGNRAKTPQRKQMTPG